MRKTFLIVLLLSALATACTPFSREVIRQSDEVLTVAEVQANPGRYLQTQVLWGGIVVEATNEKDSTLIMVLRTKLDFEKQPKDLRNTEGRFVIEYKGFLDPFVYRKGRLVTVAGDIAGVRKLAVGNTTYNYPVVAAKQLQLWETGYYTGRRPPAYWNDPFWWPRYPAPLGDIYPYDNYYSPYSR